MVLCRRIAVFPQTNCTTFFNLNRTNNNFIDVYIYTSYYISDIRYYGKTKKCYEKYENNTIC